MPTWNAQQYLRFGRERTQPCRDLAGRVAVISPRRVIDLGCGPGNSTSVLRERWPQAYTVGLDSSSEMIETARQADDAIDWLVGDVAEWSHAVGERFDVVFSNAALQWVDDHAGIFPRLLARVSPGGALAVQIPGNFDGPAHRAMRELAASTAWRGYFPGDGVREWHVHELPFYYDVFAPHAATLQLWETEYLHVLPNAEAVVDWYEGTGLRPFLDSLASDDLRARFVADYLRRIRPLFPARSDGNVLFPFRRLFVIAYQST